MREDHKGAGPDPDEEEEDQEGDGPARRVRGRPEESPVAGGGRGYPVALEDYHDPEPLLTVSVECKP